MRRLGLGESVHYLSALGERGGGRRVGFATRALAIFLAATLPLVVPLRQAVAQSSASGIVYIYDDLNRLVGVVDQDGNAATYTYDAVGNILKIERVDAAPLPGKVAITLVSPNKGKVGSQVQIFGKGFSASASQNSVAFNGVPGTVASAAPNRLVATVPVGATTGSITLTAPLGNATSPSLFVVFGSALTVSPAIAFLFPGAAQQFEARLDGTPTANVRWDVNGVPGGRPATGTITAGGLYQAPAAVGIAATFTVTAVHLEDLSVTASASVPVQPYAPNNLASAAVSVAVAQTATVDRNVGATVSVIVETGGTAVDRNVVASVSAVVQTGGASFVASLPVSATVTPSGAAIGESAALASSAVPVVASVIPGSAARGTTAVGITITGSGFGDAMQIVFLRDGFPDHDIVVHSFVVWPGGMSASAEITVDGAAPVGARVVQIVTVDHASTPTGTGGNLFTIE